MRVWFEKDDFILQRKRFLIEIARGADAVAFLHPDGGQYTVPATPGTAMALPDDVYWRIPFDAMRPLMDALAGELDTVYAGDVAVLRKDFEHERGRVDRFIDTLTAMTTQALQPVILTEARREG